MLKPCAPMIFRVCARAPASFLTVNTRMKFSSAQLDMLAGRFCARESAAKRVVFVLLSLMTLSTIFSPNTSLVSSEAIAAIVASFCSLTYRAASAVFENV